MSQKRIRSINWDEEEKQLFRTVLKEYAHIIENKSLDTNTNKIKAKAWEEFHNKFNQLNRRPRELSQLKIQWKTMKINARKIYNNFQRESKKTGGGTRPPTPNESIIEIKDLLNPAELLRDSNVYDSDGVMHIEFPTTSDTSNMCTEMIENADEVCCQKLTPVAISQVTPVIATPMEIKIDTIPVKTPPVNKTMANSTNSMTSTPAKKVAKRKINFNRVVNSGTSTKKDHDDYINKMISHSRILKDEEHMRRMEIMEEEYRMKKEKHAIEIEIQREKLKSAVLEREILELKKQREFLLNKS